MWLNQYPLMKALEELNGSLILDILKDFLGLYWGFKLVLWVQNQQKLPFEYWDGSVDFDLAHATLTSLKSEFCVLLRNKNMKNSISENIE